MNSDDYWWCVAVLRDAGFRPVSDFYRYHPVSGNTVVYLDGPNDGPGLGPWWTGGTLTTAVTAVVVPGMTQVYTA